MLLSENTLRPLGLDESRKFWNPVAQTMGAGTLRRLAAEGLATEWSRAWDLPMPFYRDRFERAGFSRDEVPDLDDIPLTTKNDLRANEAEHLPFGTHRPFGIEKAVRLGKSTGTTGGRPVFIMMGPRDLENAIELQSRTIWSFPLRPGQRFTHAWPGGLYVSSTTTGFYYVRTGVLELPMGPPVTPEEAASHLQLWEFLKPDGFLLSLSQWEIYQQAAHATGVDFQAIVGGKTVALFDMSFQFEGPRSRVENEFGITIRNMGGVGEVPGFGSTDCEYRTGLHAPSDFMIMQAVDAATGRSMPDGERGHMVITTFGFDAFFVRYDVEDIVTVTHEPCPCGHTGTRFQVLGRSADAVRVAGRTILPVDVQVALNSYGSPEFQLLIGDGSERDLLSVRLEAEDDRQAAGLSATLASELSVPVDVERVEPGTLPRSTFKPRRIAT
jgi:phenylacetate-CoA ligase